MKKRIGAYVSGMGVIVMMALSLITSTAFAADAQQTQVRKGTDAMLWKDPGRAPFKGPIEEVSILQEEKSGLPRDEFMRGIDILNEDECKTHFLQDGEYFWNSFTANGVSDVVWTKVAMEYQIGDIVAGKPLLENDVLIGTPLPPLHEKRRSLKCDLGEVGASVIYPFVCGNWGVMPHATQQLVEKPAIAPKTPEVVVIVDTPKVASDTTAVVVTDLPKETEEVVDTSLCVTDGFVSTGTIFTPGFITPVSNVGYLGHKGSFYNHGNGTFGVVPASTASTGVWNGCQPHSIKKDK